MSFCASIFNSKGYDITGVSVTYKRNIGRWVTVESRMEETRDSRGVGKSYNSRSHVLTHPLSRSNASR